MRSAKLHRFGFLGLSLREDNHVAAHLSCELDREVPQAAMSMPPTRSMGFVPNCWRALKTYCAAAHKKGGFFSEKEGFAPDGVRAEGALIEVVVAVHMALGQSVS